MSVIETRGLTKYYGRARGIVGLDLEVEEGETFGFLGPNGSGKTTTIRLLLSLIRPSSGEARIFGKEVSADSLAIRKQAGYLPGELGLPQHLTGFEFLARMASLREAHVRDRAAGLARRLDLDLSRRIRTLSHGTRQKIGIVQALMHDARLLILDEPTIGLDPLARQAFYELLFEERERGKTVFLSSHQLIEVERTCARVGVIREGRLVVVEEIRDLKKKRVKWAEAELKVDADPEAFKMPGVRSVEAEGHRLKLSMDGNYGEVLRALSDRGVENITIRDATLEEIFMEYYQAGEDEP